MECKACEAWFCTTSDDELCSACERAMKRLRIDLPYSRLSELLEADRDERIIVLPKKATLISAVCQNKDGIYLMNHMGVYEVNSEVCHEPKE